MTRRPIDCWRLAPWRRRCVAEAPRSLPRLSLRAVCRPAGCRPERVRRAALALHRSVPRRTRQRRHRRARPAEHVLLGLGRRRRLEDDQRRPDLGPDFRLAADRLDRRGRRRARRTPTSFTSAPAKSDMRSQISFGNGMYKSTDAGKTWRHLGLDDTRQIARVARSIRAIPTSCSSRRSATSTAPTRIAASIVRATAARPGRRSCSRATTSARSISHSIRRTRRRSTRRCGTPVVRRGASIRRRTGRAAGSTSPPTAAPTGRRSRAVCRLKASAASASRSPPSNRARVYAIVDAKDGGLYRSDDAGATLA